MNRMNNLIKSNGKFEKFELGLPPKIYELWENFVIGISNCKGLDYIIKRRITTGSFICIKLRYVIQ